MKLVNETMTNAAFNIAGKIIKTNHEGVIELADSSVADILIRTAGFKLLRVKGAKEEKNLYVEPKAEEVVVAAEADVNPEELEADAEAEKELAKEPPKQEKKWLPGSNNKKK
jgi:hypothetical protein